ncbi:MAG TPA: V-type ATP synthase subunit D [Thermoanaerobaculia bacterium]
MIPAASRSRLNELRRDRTSAVRGADLLDRKREVLLREMSRRTARAEAMRREVERTLAGARRRLRIAEVHLGREGVTAAGFAQPATTAIDCRESAIMGVRFASVRASSPPYRAAYGPASTSESLDAAGAAFSVLVPRVVELAAEESAVARLRVAVRKVTKIVNALQKVIIPRLEQQIRMTVDSIAEEERDEAIRRKVRLGSELAVRR